MLSAITGTLSAIDRNCCPQSIGDRKSTRLNSSHQIISYAVFCLKKKTVHEGARLPSCRFFADAEHKTDDPGAIAEAPMDQAKCNSKVIDGSRFTVHVVREKRDTH